MKKIILFILLISSCLFVGCAKKYKYTVEEIKIETKDFSLSAKLTLPETKKQVPAVIIIQGSGPNDMDGTIYALKPYKEISEKLAQKGIASIRFHKRTFEFNNNVAKNFQFTIEDEYIEDTLQAFNVLAEDERIAKDNTYLIGHSMGAAIAPLIINRQPKIKGGILLAGSTAHILDILLEQTKDVNEKTYQSYLQAVNITKSLTEVKKGEEHYHYFGSYGAYWVHYNQINFDNELLNAANNHPLLIMQGGTDLQIYSHHFEKYQSLLANSLTTTFKHYPSLNHCFVEGEGETILTAYREAKNIPDYVIKDIYDWINNQK